MSDADLLQRLRRGEALAIHEVVAQHGPRVYNLLVRLSRDGALAEDLLQDTFVSLVTHGPKLNEETRLGPWLTTVAVNRWRSYRRWAFLDFSRWLVAEPDEGAKDSAPTPEEVLVQDEQARVWEQAIGSLKEGDRAVLLLALEDGLDAHQRAQALGLTEEAFRKRLSRLRAHLRDKLGLTLEEGIP